MKTRNGFVSNSSSSSFVIVGIDLPRENYTTPKQLLELAQQLGFDGDEDDAIDFLYNQPFKNGIIVSDEDDGAPQGKIIIGCLVSRPDIFGGGGLEPKSVDLNTTVKQVEKVLEKMGIIKPLKIFSGTRMC